MTLRDNAESFRLMFANNPLPMWVYDLKDLKFIEVNTAAVAHYGYTRDEFLAMRIGDIRHPNEAPRPPADATRQRPGLQLTGEWRHRCKDGRVIDVYLVSHTLEFDGRSAVLVAALDITERKRALAAVEQSEAQKSAILRGALDGIITIDHRGRILEFNPAAEAIFKHRRKDVLGRELATLIVPQGLRDGHRQGLERYLATGESAILDKRIEITALRATGEEFPVELAVIRDPGSDPPVFTGFVRDITERKRAEEALVRLAGIVESSDDAIYGATLDGIITNWNQGAERIYGYRAEDVIGRHASLLMPPDRPDELSDILARLRGSERITNFETSRMRSDGRQIAVSVTISPMADAAGNILGVSAIARDVTERKRLEEERETLVAQERQARTEAELVKQRLAFLAEASKQLASSLDYRSTLTKVAQLAVPALADWCVIDALDEDDTIRRVTVTHVDPSKIDLAAEFERRYPPDPNAPTGVPNVLRTGKSEFYPEISDAMLVKGARDPEHLKILRGLGFTSAMIVPLVGRDRWIVGAITLVTATPGWHFTTSDLEMAEDLARRCAVAIENALLYGSAQALNAVLEDRVARRTADLEKANQELAAFTYSIAHDLRAPLITIGGFSEMLAEDYAAALPEDALRITRQIVGSARHLSALITDLLTFSRLSNQPVNQQPVAPADVARLALADLDAVAAGRQGSVHIGDLPPCRGDPALLKQVFVNLLSNALKFSRNREDATIEVGWLRDQADSTHHTLFVKDNGVGFDMQYADKLWRVFQRLHRADDFEGTGVGLAIVQRIIQRHGGRVWAESEPGKGATFYFTLDRETPAGTHTPGSQPSSTA